jgi:hypothetical protein
MRKLNILQQCIVAKNKVFFLLQAMFLASWLHVKWNSIVGSLSLCLSR